MSRSTHPPRFFLKMFRWFCHPDLRQPIEGDLMELYEERISAGNRRKANLLFIRDVLLLFRPGIIRPAEGVHTTNFYGMVKNYFKITLRVLLKHRLITSASLLSLIIGVLCFYMIFSWVNNELRTDQFHSNIDRIHALLVKATPQADFEPVMDGYFKDLKLEEFPHIIKKLRVHRYSPDYFRIAYEEGEFPTRGYVVDSTFFDLFDFPIVYGNKVDPLVDPSGIFITESYSKRLFGEENPIGKIVEVKCDQKGNYQVAGVIGDIPSNSSLDFEVLIPSHSQRFWTRSGETLFLTDGFFDSNTFNEEIEELGRTHEQFMQSVLSSVPVKDIYFDHHFESSIYYKFGDLKYVTVMVVIGVFILLISTLIFGNLQTTLQLSNLRAMGIKRVNGASKNNLILEMFIGRLYFLLTTILIVSIAFKLIFPIFLRSLDLQVDHHFMNDLSIITLVTSAIILVSMVLSVFQIAKVEVLPSLRNRLVSINVARLQKSLTTVQFTFTIILIISTVVAFQQFIYLLNKDVGFEAQSIISFESVARRTPYNLPKEERKVLKEEERGKFQYFTNELNNNPDILKVSQSEMPVNSMAFTHPWKLMGKDSYHTLNAMTVDPGYKDMLDLEMMQGRFFSDSIDRSRQKKVVVNEATLRFWGVTGDPIGQQVANSYWGEEKEPYTIIGVIKDYHYEHLSNKIKPLVLLYMFNRENDFMVKLKSGRESEALSYIKKLYNEVNPKSTFNYVFLKNEIESQYRNEKKLSEIYLIFTVIALALSAMGLFTFAIHETRRRTKEIGIRKINGASIRNIFYTLGIT
ncbi:MAG: ABC transporter permease, partial [Cyclobacteriaceae bacterium]